MGLAPPQRNSVFVAASPSPAGVYTVVSVIVKARWLLQLGLYVLTLLLIVPLIAIGISEHFSGTFLALGHMPI